MMYNPKRLHPASMIFNAVTLIRQFVYGLLPVIILGSGNGYFIYNVLGISLLVLLLIGYNVLAWLSFTYRMDGDQLIIEQGVFIKKNRMLSKNRIQSIDLTQSVIHRILGLTKVQIETAGSDRKTDATLSAVTLEEGQFLRKELKTKHDLNITEEESHKRPVSRFMSFKRLLVAGSTSGSLGVMLGLFAYVISEVENVIPATVYERTTTWLLAQRIEVIIGLVLILILFIWIVGVLGIVIKYGKFMIRRNENELFITRGLLEKREMTIPIKRIQGVAVKESLIRQPLGFAAISVEIAGGVKENNKVTETVIFPLLRKGEVPSFLQEILPEYQELPSSYITVPKRGLSYYLLQTSLIPIIVLIVVTIVISKWLIIPIVILVLSILLGIARYCSTGYHLTNNQLTLRLRLFNKETVMLKQHRIQSLERRQHFLQRKQNLASIKMSILNNSGGRSYYVRHLEVSHVDRIVDWYSYRN